jgi:acyl-CoA thioester hydrolase
MNINITEYRVIYADLDPMGVVYYANYLSWFERGRTEFFRELELPYAEIAQQGIVTPVSEVYCKYHRPARYDDILVIKSTLLVSGYTKHGFVDLAGKIVRIPEFIHEKITSLMQNRNSAKKKQ